MPVWVATDPNVDLNDKGERRRHITDQCPNWQKVDAAVRCKPNGRPNTKTLKETTVRCEHPQCWEKRIAEDAAKPKRAKGTGTRGSKKAATVTPTAKVGGKAGSLADRAKAARTKPGSKPASKTPAAVAA